MSNKTIWWGGLAVLVVLAVLTWVKSAPAQNMVVEVRGGVFCDSEDRIRDFAKRSIENPNEDLQETAKAVTLSPEDGCVMAQLAIVLGAKSDTVESRSGLGDVHAVLIVGVMTPNGPMRLPQPVPAFTLVKSINIKS